MDRDHLTHLIDDPARVQHDDITDLRAMTERYPWFSAAHLLLAVGEHRQGDVLFDEQLRTSAAHLPSRSVLFDQVHVSRPVPPRSEQEEQPPTAEPTRIEAKLDVLEPVVAAPPLEEFPRPREQDAPDPLDQQMRQSALAGSYELLIEHAGATLMPAIDLAQEQPTDLPQAEPMREVIEPVERFAMLPSALSFIQWLELADRDVTAVPARDTGPAMARKEEGRLTNAADAMGTEPDTKALIHGFIQQAAPQAPIKKTEFFNPQQAAKRSLEDHADLVTETLARIYEKQGNHVKAITAYERLAVKHPERSAYFRALAKGLEGK